MAELKWVEYEDDGWHSWGAVWFIQPYEDQGFKLMMYDFDEKLVGSLCDTVDELKIRAQRIENVLDPPECPVGHGSTFEFYRRQLTLVMGDRGEPEVGEEVVLIEPKFCPDCGQPLTEES